MSLNFDSSLVTTFKSFCICVGCDVNDVAGHCELVKGRQKDRLLAL